MLFRSILEGDRISELSDLDRTAELWTLRLDDLRERLSRSGRPGDLALADVTVLPPVDGRTEVWASGVTYEISREARVEESERSADIYTSRVSNFLLATPFAYLRPPRGSLPHDPVAAAPGPLPVESA